MLTHNGLRPIVNDEDEQAIAALSEEERAALLAWADEWDMEQREWERRRAATQRALVLCLPTAAISAAVLWGA
jgi:hypothetical protein